MTHNPMTNAHDNRNLDDHKGKSFQIQGKEGNWEGQELNVSSDPLVDAGTGKPYVLRCFRFSFNPEIKVKPTKQDLFNHHWKQIRNMLWADGLVHVEEVNPRVVVKKKGYRIFVLAKPRLGVNVFDKTQTLQELMKK